MSSSHEDGGALRAQHTTEAIRRRIGRRPDHSHLGDFVLGAVDGTVTTFAIVAGSAGAGLSAGAALVLGLANVVADGFSMATSNFLKSRADQQIVERARLTEERHVDAIPDGEREEIRQIFAGKGFDGRVLDEVVEVITRDRRRWVDTMLVEEWGLQLDRPSATRAAVVTFWAFALAGLVPLVPLAFAGPVEASRIFAVSAALTGVTFFGIGALRGRFSARSPLRTGLETLLVGGGAAGMAYGIGALLRGWA